MITDTQTPFSFHIACQYRSKGSSMIVSKHCFAFNLMMVVWSTEVSWSHDSWKCDRLFCLYILCPYIGRAYIYPRVLLLLLLVLAFLALTIFAVSCVLTMEHTTLSSSPQCCCFIWISLCLCSFFSSWMWPLLVSQKHKHIVLSYRIDYILLYYFQHREMSWAVLNIIVT